MPGAVVDMIDGQAVGATVACEELDHRMLTHGPTLELAECCEHGR